MFKEFFNGLKKKGIVYNWFWSANLKKKPNHIQSKSNKFNKTICVNFAKDLKAGVDLEYFDPSKRNFSKHMASLRKRFNLSDDCSDKEVFKQWLIREASFKAMSPDNSRLLLNSFEIEGDLLVYKEMKTNWNSNPKITKLRPYISWEDPWVMAVAVIEYEARETKP